MTTANMGLTLPDVSVTPGPTWASQINSDLTLIDQHNHTSGFGSRIPTDGLLINAELKFNQTTPNGIPATGLSRVGLLSPQTPPVATGVYSDASGDLYYDNAAGIPVQITVGNSIAGATGSITGMTPESSASFDGGTGAFIWQKDAGAPEAATMDSGPLRVRDGTVGANAITITPPSGLASAYTLTLPPDAPASQRILTANAGVSTLAAVDSTLTLTSSLLKVANLGIGTAQLADGSVSTAKLGAGSVATSKIADGNVTQIKWGPKTVSSSSSVSQSTSSTTQVTIAGLSVSITARAGHAIRVEVMPSGSGTSLISCGSNSGGYISLLQVAPSSATLCDLFQGAENQPVNSICAIINPSVNGVYTFAAYWFVNTNSPFYTLNITNAKIVAYEL